MRIFGLGFPLGDRCTIESGLYITAGTKVTMLDASGNEVEVAKARDLAENQIYYSVVTQLPARSNA